MTRRCALELLPGLTVIILLAAARWFVMSDPAHFSTWMPAEWFHGPTRSLTRQALNTATTLVFLVVLPWLLWGCARRLERSRATRLTAGWGVLKDVPELGGQRSVAVETLLSGLRKRWVIGGLVAGAFVIGLAAPLAFPAVRAAYPINEMARHHVAHLALAECLTACLILGTELFYRGGALFHLERRLGLASALVLAPIYVLDHLGAPAVEVLGSGATALLLGLLALATRRIWPGVLIHLVCAVSVDVSSSVVG